MTTLKVVLCCLITVLAPPRFGEEHLRLHRRGQSYTVALRGKFPRATFFLSRASSSHLLLRTPPWQAVGRSNYAERLSNLIRKDQCTSARPRIHFTQTNPCVYVVRCGVLPSVLFQHFFSIPERDQAHKATEAQKHKSGSGDRLRFHMLRTLSRSREHRIEEEGTCGGPHAHALYPATVRACVSAVVDV